MVREKLIEYINRMGIKQISICEKTGITPQAMSGIMNRKRELEVDEYVAICQALQVRYDYFMNDEPHA